MLIGVLLVLTWLILLLRYPLRAAPISLGAALALALVAGWVLVEEQREARLIARLELQLQHRADLCPAARPLWVKLTNHGPRSLLALSWRVAAYAPGTRLNVAERSFETPDYQEPGELQPGASWEACMPLPPLRAGYRPSTLTFRAEDLDGRFGD
ncbi:multidrug transporter [Pseudomonas oligotrophica]|uniref:multidrug transporter n=1 Tax=Pseudomonas oligotrophica TaxID=2912055 RepID=UPI001F3B0E37|nr:multidrug transporter [Pseudomonas oligotrophica]MCF7201893.1 multidrug transporter [Pseudomonas oligotrophica]